MIVAWWRFGRTAVRRKPSRTWSARLESLEPRIVPASVSVGTAFNIQHLPGNQDENWIAVNPTNPKNVVAITVDEFTLNNSTSGVRYFYSFDGGQTWNGQLLATSTGGISDGKVYFDQYGNLFVTYIDSPAGNFSIEVQRSTDGGRTLTPEQTIDAGSIDQPSMAVGPTSVWITYNKSGVIYAAGATDVGLGAIGTFSTPESAGNGGNFGDIAVGPNGQAAVTYVRPTGGTGPAAIYFAVSSGIGQPFGAESLVTNTSLGGFTPIGPQANRTVDAEPNLAYDNSTGAHRGRLYLIDSDSAAVGNDNTDVFVRYSDNDGATWSTPVKVNDDGGTNSQFLPGIACDIATGDVAVSFYDARNSPTNTQAQLFVTASNDGGATFVANQPVVAGLSTAGITGNELDYGDYNGVTIYNNVIHVIFSDNSGSVPGNAGNTFDVGTATVTFNAVPPPPPPPPPTPLVGTVYVGSGEGSLPWVMGLDPNTGAVRFRILAFDPAFRGGVRVASADVNGDGVPDIIAAAGPGGGPQVKVFSGSTGALLESFYAYDPNFKGGVYVAAADFNGDGHADIVTGAGPGGGPHVKLFSGKNGQLFLSFYAYSANFHGGVTVAVGKVDRDRVPDIIVGSGPGMAPHVNVFSGKNGGLIRSFSPYFGNGFTNGIFVAAGDVNGDGVADIIVSPGAGASPMVYAYDGLTLAIRLKLSAFPYAAASNVLAHPSPNNTGVRVATFDFNGDGIADIIVSTGPGGPNRVRIFDGAQQTQLIEMQPFDASFLGGVFVAG